MITSLNNSSQPYLYVNENNLLMLYCFAESSVTRVFGDASYKVRPWKIKLYNLNTDLNITLNTITSLPDKGQVVVECNPHIFIHNNQIELCYTAGFAKTATSPIVYYFCSMKSDNLSFDNLYDFQIISKTFNGTYLNSNNYLLIDKKNYDVDTITQNLKINNKIIDSYSNFNLEEILRIINVFNSNYFLITGKKENNYISYLLNNDLSINKKIQNNNNENVYKCSIYPKVLAYTNVLNTEEQDQTNEQRSIVIEYSL
jgi:hypothetical protein